jgi:hypothetical protein
MTSHKKEISKEIYDRAMQNNKYITEADKNEIFTISQLCGYGVYGAIAVEEDGKYYCKYSMGSSCD